METVRIHGPGRVFCPLHGLHIVFGPEVQYCLDNNVKQKENQWMKMSSTDARGDIMGTGDIKTADLISELEYVSKSIL